MAVYDAIVIGTGGVGSAALFHLALRGARVLGLDRFSAGHDRGSSHGQTRIIRQAYYEHPDYVPMVLRAYQLWHDLEERADEKLYHEVGLLQVGPASGEVVSGVRASARLHGLAIENLSAPEAMARFAGFRVPTDCEAVFERRAGYLLVERCVLAHLEQAKRLGAVHSADETVRAWRVEDDYVLVETERTTYAAAKLIIAGGAWSAPLLADLDIPLIVRRKAVFWWQTSGHDYHAERGCPCYLFELPQGIFYGFPQIDERGMKMAEHTGGLTVADPLSVNREVDPTDVQRLLAFITAQLPRLAATYNEHSVCLYTMSPDSHFIVDRHPRHPQVALAAGLSGHGFKFTSVLGEILAQLALDGASKLPIEFLAVDRPALRHGRTRP